ncbi:MAG: hypothetical protein H0W83_11625 [Planctomycetes bacterium]|nr:hypothetical protein [Planctomycetota bacterium]
MHRTSSQVARLLLIIGALIAGTLAPVSGATYSSSAAITITDASAATPYPAQITVGGLDGQKIAKVRVTLNNISHDNLADVDVLLVGPGGQSVVVLSDFGGAVSGLSLAFDDDALATLSGSPISGSYKPTEAGGFLDPFPAPAPARPYGSTLSAFTDTDPNGVWSLYVVDAVGGATGSIASPAAPPGFPVAGVCVLRRVAAWGR